MNANAACAVTSLEPRCLLSAATPNHLIVADPGDGPLLPALTAAGNSKFTIANGGFETFTPNDLQGWNTSGNAASVIGDYYPAPEGISQALVSNGTGGPGLSGPSTAASLDSFLGLSKGALEKRGVVNGSAITQTFKSGAFELLTFQLDFLTNEDGKSDFGFVTVNNGHQTQVYKITDSLHPMAAAGKGSGLVSETGYGKYTLFLPRGGNYTIGFGVTNVGSVTGLSTVLVDNVQLTPLFPAGLFPKSIFPDSDNPCKPMNF